MRKIILEILAVIEGEYPVEMRTYIRNNLERFVYQVEKTIEFMGGRTGTLLDVGAGFSPFALICAKLGMNITIADDFGDPMHVDQSVLAIFQKYGVRVLSGDIFRMEWPFAEGELDVITTFDSMEHWHQSPKELFHKLFGLLKQRGVLWINVPNCVNMRKRITIPLGYGKWSSMRDWYENPVFRGHVREPDVDDLRYIAKDLGCAHPVIDGKNWIGYRSPKMWIRLLTPWVDKLLQLNPALCSDIYIVVRKEVE